MKMEEIALMQAFWDRFDKSLETMFKAIQEENSAQRAHTLALVRAGASAAMQHLEDDARNVKQKPINTVGIGTSKNFNQGCEK